MPEKQYEFPLPIGTVIEGGDMTDGRVGEHYQYHIEEVLGQGGFGITYKVWAIIRYGQIEMKAWFAIKEHFVRGRCHRASDGKTVEYSIEAREDVEDSLKDFIKEGRLLHQICHVKNPGDKQNEGWRHVVPVNEVIEANNTAYFVMQYLDGGSIKAKAPMGEEQALSYMRPICQAVAYIHRHGILHMDIKPENIVMRRDLKTQYEEPVLIDFGVSLHFDRKGNLTTTHTSFGRTDGFSPIEQYGAVTDFQPKIDVYALGATLFYLLTGTVPPMSLILERSQLEEMLPDNLSQRTRAAILHAMTKEPSRRTPSATRLLEELEDSISLPRGYKLVSPHATYLITDVREVTADYILYDAVPYQENVQSEGDNVTKTFQYKVMERFVKGQSKRQSDNAVVHASAGAGMFEFWQQAEKTMELTETGQAIRQGNHLERETFEANGTTYAVCDTRFRPESSTSKAMRKMKKSATASIAAEDLANGWQKAKKPLMWTALGALVIGIGILLAPTVKGWFESQQSSSTSSGNPSTSSQPNQPSQDTPTFSSEDITVNGEKAEKFTVNGVTFTMVAVQGGTFMMGATEEQGDDSFDDEKPAHRVSLSDYCIGQTEVTQALWQAVMDNNPSYFKDPNLPVEKVSWNDCQTFITKLNQITGRRFRLPSEAEWEYAARGGNKSHGYKYSGSNTLSDVAWYDGNSDSKTHPVGQKQANELGLYDMSGNVYEWCQDWFDGTYYGKSQSSNPCNNTSGESSCRVFRGGTWNHGARYSRVSSRDGLLLDYIDNYFGLRLAM